MATFNKSHNRKATSKQAALNRSESSRSQYHRNSVAVKAAEKIPRLNGQTTIRSTGEGRRKEKKGYISAKHTKCPPSTNVIAMSFMCTLTGPRTNVFLWQPRFIVYSTLPYETPKCFLGFYHCSYCSSTVVGTGIYLF
ncbi:hypothetical protein CDAR_474361 [Caerostris darwini]|uniref:60S ribosomal protein L29 n=1 Tax=Caerostris darwini TaxID=1538125 RepID=A0AAV4M5S1_9ARAC|nr:hypothetical protein CDAR_474361 [Caerostris darwini]